MDCTTVCQRKGLTCEVYTVPKSKEGVMQLFKEAGVYGGEGCTPSKVKEAPNAALTMWYRFAGRETVRRVLLPRWIQFQLLL